MYMKKLLMSGLFGTLCMVASAMDNDNSKKISITLPGSIVNNADLCKKVKILITLGHTIEKVDAEGFEKTAYFNNECVSSFIVDQRHIVKEIDGRKILRDAVESIYTNIPDYLRPEQKCIVCGNGSHDDVPWHLNMLRSSDHRMHSMNKWVCHSEKCLTAACSRVCQICAVNTYTEPKTILDSAQAAINSESSMEVNQQEKILEEDDLENVMKKHIQDLRDLVAVKEMTRSEAQSRLIKQYLSLGNNEFPGKECQICFNAQEEDVFHVNFYRSKKHAIHGLEFGVCEKCYSQLPQDRCPACNNNQSEIVR